MEKGKTKLRPAGTFSPNSFADEVKQEPLDLDAECRSSDEVNLEIDHTANDPNDMTTWTTKELSKVLRSKQFSVWAKLVEEFELNGNTMNTFADRADYLHFLKNEYQAISGATEKGMIKSSAQAYCLLQAMKQRGGGGITKDEWQIIQKEIRDDKIKEEEEQRKQQEEDEQKLVEEVDIFNVGNLDLKKYKENAEKYLPKRNCHYQDMIVPVYMTVVIKTVFEDDERNGRMMLRATVVQRPLFIDLEKVIRSDGKDTVSYFHARINEGEANDSSWDLRKTVKERTTPVKWTHDSDGKVDKMTGVTATSTFAVDIPMVKRELFTAHPFHILTCSVLIELTSFAGELDGEFYQFRPDLMCHKHDKRNLICVKEWMDFKVDEMHTYELINTSPTVEYILEGKKAGKDPTYVPKVKITYYLQQNAIRPFLETIVPVIFASIANGLNSYNVLDEVANEDDDEIELLYVPEFLGNAFGLGLLVVFIIPQLSDSTSFEKEHWEWNHAFVAFIFLGICLSMLQVLPNITSENRRALRVLSVCSMTLSLLIPVSNCIFFNSLVKLIKNATPHIASHSTFNGKPGTLSDPTGVMNPKEMAKIDKDAIVYAGYKTSDLLEVGFTPLMLFRRGKSKKEVEEAAVNFPRVKNAIVKDWNKWEQEKPKHEPNEGGDEPAAQDTHHHHGKSSAKGSDIKYDELGKFYAQTYSKNKEGVCKFDLPKLNTDIPFLEEGKEGSEIDAAAAKRKGARTNSRTTMDKKNSRNTMDTKNSEKPNKEEVNKGICRQLMEWFSKRLLSGTDYDNEVSKTFDLVHFGPHPDRQVLKHAKAPTRVHMINRYRSISKWASESIDSMSSLVVSSNETKNESGTGGVPSDGADP